MPKRMRLDLCFGVPLLLLSLSAVTSCARTGKDYIGCAPITVVLRYDDYSARSDSANDRRLIALLKQFRMAATFAVIPYVHSLNTHNPAETTLVPLEGKKLEILKEAVDSVGIEVALHGYSHQTNQFHVKGPDYSEFGGLGFDEQLRRILKGRDLLQMELGVRPRIFVPPWGAYDSVTLNVLESLGFQMMSAHITGVRSRSRMKFLPSTCTLDDLRSAVRSARSMGDPHPVVVVLLHPSDLGVRKNGMVGAERDSLESSLEWLSSQPDVEVRSIGQLVERGESLQQDRFKSYELARAGLPSTIPFLRLKPLPFYPSMRALGRIRGEQSILTWLSLIELAFAAAILSTFLGVLLRRRGRSIILVMGFASCAMIILVVLSGVISSDWSYQRLMVLAVLLGIAAAAWRRNVSSGLSMQAGFRRD
jgi:peptidoglycan/xylan/chitin deacetylase (PgdA/CDA1 family)